MTDFVNTRTTLGEQATLDGLVAHTLETFNENGVTSIGQYALYKNSGLVHVDMPALTSAGQYAFQDCINLESASFEALTSMGNYMFSGCTKLSSINIPNVTSLSQYAFKGCKALTTFSNDKITSLGNYSFNESGVTTVSLPNITTVSNYAFQNCKSLTTVSVPKATSINQYSFGGCTKLRVLDLTNTAKPTIAANAFNGSGITHLIIRSTTVATLSNVSAFTGTQIRSGYGAIYVPADLVDTYKSASNWSTFADKIYPISEYPKVDYGTITDSWAEIFAAEDNGTYKTKYSVGDTKSVDVGGAIVLMQIAAFDEDTSKITWLCKDIYENHVMNSTGTTSGGWPATEMRTYLTEEIYNNIASSVKSRIVQVSKSYYDYSTSSTKTSDDYVWIPSYREVNFGTDRENSGIVYSGLFTDSGTGSSTARVKNYNGSAGAWWLRSAYSSSAFCYVNSLGSNRYNSANYTSGVVFGFCT